VSDLLLAKASAELVDYKGRTALIHAVVHHHLHAVKHLVEVPCNLLHRAKDGRTAYEIARDNNDVKIMEVLEQAMARGSDKNCRVCADECSIS